MARSVLRVMMLIVAEGVMIVEYELLESLMMTMKHSKMGSSGPFIDQKGGRQS
jgi:hypothetical protein